MKRLCLLVRKFSLVTIAAACFVGICVGIGPVSAKPSYVGVNIPWLNSGSMNYGHDFKSGYYNSSVAHEALADIKSHDMNMVRVWCFEGFQGLNMSGDYIDGVDGTFLNNVADFVSYANSEGIKVEVVCFNYADIANNPSIMTNSANQNSMVSACRALASRLNGYNYQIDLCNEGNLAVTNGISWTNFHDFIYNACQACHSVSGAWVTMSDQNASDYSSGNFYNTVGGIGCNYYEFHQYSEGASLLAGVPDGKPIELGEYGPPSSGGANVDVNNYSDWNNVIDNFQNAVAGNGNYFSLMAWCYFPDGEGYQLTNGDFTWNTAGWTVEYWGQRYGY